MAAIPRVVARTLEELEGAAGMYGDDMLQQAFLDRGSRTTMQWVNQVTTGLPTKFSMLKSDAIESEQLESVYDLAMRVNELKRFLSHCGLLDMFMIYEVDETGEQRVPGEPPRNLLDNYGTISLDNVKKSVRWVKQWSEDHFVWAETLTLRLVEASCEPGLRERVNERMMGIDPFTLGGATYFKYAMMCITSMSYTVSMTLSIHLTKLTIKQFEGEDVLKLISFLRGAIQRLTMNDMLPPHMPYLIYQMFQTSSCEQFNSFFASLYAREQADVAVAGGTTQLEIETLFQLADQQYRTYVEDGSWVKKAKKGSGFLAGVICWFCKQEGHLAKDCKKKQKQQKSGGGNGKGNANAADGKGNAPSQPWKKPPGPGEPNERVHKGKNEYYCATCKCWNRTHTTQNHKTKAELQAQKDAGQANATSPSGNGGSESTPPPAETGSVSNAAFLSNGFS